METFGINTTEEAKKKSVLYGIGVFLFEVGIIFILVTNIIFFLNYFKVIDIRIIVNNASGSFQTR